VVKDTQAIEMRSEIHIHFTAHPTVRLGQKRCGHMDVTHSSEIQGRNESTKISDRTTPDIKDDRITVSIIYE